MDRLIKPNFVSKPYNQKEVVYIKDFWQFYLYWKNGLAPLDIYLASDDKKFTAVFDREASRPYYEKYRRFELK